tara:strand:- start:426 stop:1004 length:579 start_codon:yes stop_codon:yes gene_type:complete
VAVMTTEVIKFEEAEAATWPSVDVRDEGGTLEETLAVVPHVWQRIEDHIAYRWTARQCVWTVQGPGDWRPHLSPVSAVTVESWDETTKAWSALIAEPIPADGFYLPRDKTYRITATVGDTETAVPQPVVQAYHRLSGYLSEVALDDKPVGATTHSLKLGDGLDESTTRNPNYVARALQYSGAADLLRKYRRL